MTRRRIDDEGLTELGKRWRAVAIAHEKLVHAYMFDVVKYRLALGEDLQFGSLPSYTSELNGQPTEVHPEPAAATD